MQRNLQRTFNVAGAADCLSSGRATCMFTYILGYLFIVSFSKYRYVKRCRYLNIFVKFQSKIQENKQDITNPSK